MKQSFFEPNQGSHFFSNCYYSLSLIEISDEHSVTVRFTALSGKEFNLRQLRLLLEKTEPFASCSFTTPNALLAEDMNNSFFAHDLEFALRGVPRHALDSLKALLNSDAAKPNSAISNTDTLPIHHTLGSWTV